MSGNLSMIKAQANCIFWCWIFQFFAGVILNVMRVTVFYGWTEMEEGCTRIWVRMRHWRLLKLRLIADSSILYRNNLTPVLTFKSRFLHRADMLHPVHLQVLQYVVFMPDFLHEIFRISNFLFFDLSIPGIDLHDVSLNMEKNQPLHLHTNRDSCLFEWFIGI